MSGRDRDFVLEAAQQNGRALYYADEALKRNRDPKQQFLKTSLSLRARNATAIEFGASKSGLNDFEDDTFLCVSRL